MTEVEKLRALLVEARGLIDRNRLVLGEYETPREVAAIRKAIDAALAEPVVNDFKRGAEAMREAAALVAVERARYWTETSMAEGGLTTADDRAEEAGYIADDIHALPIPEDKP